jgi:hypothetical protein
MTQPKQQHHIDFNRLEESTGFSMYEILTIEHTIFLNYLITIDPTICLIELSSRYDHGRSAPNIFIRFYDNHPEFTIDMRFEYILNILSEYGIPLKKYIFRIEGWSFVGSKIINIPFHYNHPFYKDTENSLDMDISIHFQFIGFTIEHKPMFSDCIQRFQQQKDDMLLLK